MLFHISLQQSKEDKLLSGETYDDDRMDVAILSYNNVRQAKISPQEIPKTQQINIINKTKIS